MDFEWDMAKSDLCQISRNFDFTYVISVFVDPNLLIKRDQRWDYGEERFRTLGLLDEKVFVVIIQRGWQLLGLFQLGGQIEGG
jgi:uncharacterized DUF497 family protein